MCQQEVLGQIKKKKLHELQTQQSSKIWENNKTGKILKKLSIPITYKFGKITFTVITGVRKGSSLKGKTHRKNDLQLS